MPLTLPAGAKLPGRPGTTPGPVLVFLEGVRDFVWDGIAMTRSRGMAVLALNCSNVTLHAVNATGLSGQAAVVEGCEKRLFLAIIYIKTIVLPRQARDKHQKKLKRRCFVQGFECNAVTVACK